MCSQTWVNDHLRITTTCPQRPPFWSPNLSLYNTNLPLNNDHLLTTATNLGFRGWPLHTGLTLLNICIFMSSKMFSRIDSKTYMSLLLWKGSNHKWQRGLRGRCQGFCDEIAFALVKNSMTMGEGVKNRPVLHDVIDDQLQTHFKVFMLGQWFSPGLSQHPCVSWKALGCHQFLWIQFLFTSIGISNFLCSRKGIVEKHCFRLFLMCRKKSITGTLHFDFSSSYIRKNFGWWNKKISSFRPLQVFFCNYKH